MVIGPLLPVAMDGQRVFNQLAVGQVVRLQLVEHGINGAIVSMVGKLFRASGSLPAHAGERFWAVVDSINGDRIEVRHIAPAPPGSKDVALPELARTLGLPNDRATELVLQELLRWRLPLNNNLIIDLTAQLKALPDHEKQVYLAARSMLMALNLPEQAAVREMALDYLLGRPEASPEGQELLNRARFTQPDQGMVQVLAINGGESFGGNLYLVMPRTGNVDVFHDRIRVVLSLDTALFGSVWVDLELNKGVLWGRVIIADERFVELFGQEVYLLKRWLAGVGFNECSFRVEAGSIGSVAELLGCREEPGIYVPIDTRV